MLKALNMFCRRVRGLQVIPFINSSQKAMGRSIVSTWVCWQMPVRDAIKPATGHLDTFRYMLSLRRMFRSMFSFDMCLDHVQFRFRYMFSLDICSDLCLDICLVQICLDVCLDIQRQRLYIAGDVQWSEALQGSPSRALPKAGQGAAAVEGQSFWIQETAF